jgi:hypothetical protein
VRSRLPPWVGRSWTPNLIGWPLVQKSVYRKERIRECPVLLYLFERFASVSFGYFVTNGPESLPDLAALPVGSNIVSSGLAMPMEVLSSRFHPIARGYSFRLGGFWRGEIITVMSKKTSVNEPVEKRS